MLIGAVEATAVALCARLKVEADCGTTRANLRELLARGWISSWETVKGACDLSGAGLRPHGLDLVDFALETAGHACAPPDALPETRRAAVAAIEARLASKAHTDYLRAVALLRKLANERGGDGAAAAARRALPRLQQMGQSDAWRVVCLLALDLDDSTETVAAVTVGAAARLRREAGGPIRAWVKDLNDRSLALAAAGAPGLLAGLLPLWPAEPLPCDAIAAAMAQGPEQKATLLAAVNAAAAATRRAPADINWFRTGSEKHTRAHGARLARGVGDGGGRVRPRQGGDRAALSGPHRVCARGGAPRLRAGRRAGGDAPRRRHAPGSPDTA